MGAQNIDSQLGEVLAALRHKAGLSQEELADRAGVHRTYVSLLERGLKSPTTRTLFAIADALGSRPSLILGRVERASGGE